VSKGRYTHSQRERYCFHAQHFAPASTFRSLPGAKRREICEACYASVMAQKDAAKVMVGDIKCTDIPF
jgi:hypothetical protein